MKIFKLPDLGEGLPDAEISEWHVNIGDVVKIDQNIVSMETAKAVVEVPSPIAGRVLKLYGEAGDIIKTGAPLIEFELNQTEGAEINLEKHAAQDNPATAAGQIQVGNTVIAAQTMTPSMTNKTKDRTIPSVTVKAAPAIRALANQLNVDLSSVPGTGPNGMITRVDVENAAKSQNKNAEKFAEGSAGTAALEIGPTEPLKGTRRIMAQIMSQSHHEIVSVTVLDDAHLMNWSKDEDISVRLIQAITAACLEEPALNAWYDGQNASRRVFATVQLGLAMDTEDGLFVPVIQAAEKLSKQEIRNTIDKYKKEVSERIVSPQNLKGATITLSNFGKFAGRYANPVVVPPQVAILGVGKLREEPIAHQGQVKIARVVPLALTFDHRAVTGGEATRFLGVVIRELEKAS